MIIWFNHFLTRALNWLNDKSPVFFFTTPEMGVGNTAEEIYHGFLYARRSGKKIVILRRLSLFGHPPIANKEIFHLRSPDSLEPCHELVQFIGNCFLTLVGGHVSTTINYILINTSTVLRFIYEMPKYLLNPAKNPKPRLIYRRHWHLYRYIPIGRHLLWAPQYTDEFSIKKASAIDWGKEYGQYLPISLSARKEAQAQKLLRKMGIKDTDWFACFHIREGGYYKDVNNPRNSDITNCIAAMKTITDMGGWVIRMGDSTMKRLPPMERVIDYPFTEHKSALLDIYLIQKCRLYVGQNSGIIDISILFQKKVVVINANELTYLPPAQQNSLVIMKHVYSKKAQRFLAIKELFKEPLEWQQLTQVEPSPGYTFVENSPEEITQAVLESLSQNEKYTYTHLQNEFIEKRKAMVLPLLTDYKANMLNQESVVELQQRYRMASRTLQSRGTLGRSFLDQNWHEDALNKKTHSLNEIHP